MRQDSGIGVLDKAVGVLHAIAGSPCGLAELCERTGLPRATAHRLAAGLEVHRLLACGGNGCWQLGPALTELAAPMTQGVLQANGQIAVEPMMDVAEVASAVLHMAALPLSTNIPFMTIMATRMPYVGRG